MGYFSESDITEAEAITDYGELASEDYDIDNTLDDNRDLRLIKLVGKYVVIQDARYGGGIQYLQDQSICESFRGKYWTGYLSNAKGYSDYTGALVKTKLLKYNKPRVAKVIGYNKIKEM